MEIWVFIGITIIFLLFVVIRVEHLEKRIREMSRKLNTISQVLEIASPSLGRRLEEEGTHVGISEQWQDDMDADLLEDQS